MKKINLKAILVLCALLVPQVAPAQDFNRIERLDALVVCRSKQCKPADSIMTKEFLYNKLSSLLKSNVNQKVLLCDADPTTHTCLDDAIIFDAMVGATPAEITLPSLYVLDAKAMNDLTTEDFIADYEFKVADTYPECQSSLNTMTVSSTDDIFTETATFDCHFTSEGTTLVNATYDIDYIDLDYGIIGATYTIGLSETSQGGGSGYALLRFARSPNDENLPVNCVCGCVETQNPPCQCKQDEVSKAASTQEVVAQETKTERTETRDVVAQEKTAQAGARDFVDQEKTAQPGTRYVVDARNGQEQLSTQTNQQTVVVKERTVTQYKVAPIEVVVRTKAVSFDQMPQVKVNGVPVETEPVNIEDLPGRPQILDPSIPVIMEVEEI